MYGIHNKFSQTHWRIMKILRFLKVKQWSLDGRKTCFMLKRLQPTRHNREKAAAKLLGVQCNENFQKCKLRIGDSEVRYFSANFGLQLASVQLIKYYQQYIRFALCFSIVWNLFETTGSCKLPPAHVFVSTCRQQVTNNLNGGRNGQLHGQAIQLMYNAKNL